MILTDKSGLIRNSENCRLFSILSVFFTILLSACAPDNSLPGPLSAPEGELRVDTSEIDDNAAVRMAQRFETAGDLASASNMYSRALQMAPENTAALLGMARIYQQAGARAESARYHKRILQIQPLNSQAAAAVAEDLIFSEKPQEAVSSLISSWSRLLEPRRCITCWRSLSTSWGRIAKRNWPMQKG